MIQSYKDKLDPHALEDQGFFARGVDKKRQRPLQDRMGTVFR